MNRRTFLLGSSATVGALGSTACTNRGRVLHAPEGVPINAFNASSTAEQVTAGFDLTGQVALVTGCNSGIGFETMRVLAMRGAHVIGTGRNIAKAEKACALVEGKTTPVALELSDFDSVVDCANTVQALDLPIDILVCNAGYVAGSEQQHAYGLDLTFVINHLGHFILVNRLLEQVKRAEQGRVVMVSSFATLREPTVAIEFDDLAFSSQYDALHSYGHSKLANALFSLQLSRLLDGHTATANALHPGVIKTKITRNLNGVFRWLFGLYADLFNKTIEQGAATTAYVATHPSLKNVSGYFFNDCNPVIVESPSNNLYNEGMAEKLWHVSSQLTSDYLS